MPVCRSRIKKTPMYRPDTSNVSVCPETWGSKPTPELHLIQYVIRTGDRPVESLTMWWNRIMLIG